MHGRAQRNDRRKQKCCIFRKLVTTSGSDERLLELGDLHGRPFHFPPHYLCLLPSGMRARYIRAGCTNAIWRDSAQLGCVSAAFRGDLGAIGPRMDSARSTPPLDLCFLCSYERVSLLACLGAVHVVLEPVLCWHPL